MHLLFGRIGQITLASENCLSHPGNIAGCSSNTVDSSVFQVYICNYSVPLVCRLLRTFAFFEKLGLEVNIALSFRDDLFLPLWLHFLNLGQTSLLPGLFFSDFILLFLVKSLLSLLFGSFCLRHQLNFLLFVMLSVVRRLVSYASSCKYIILGLLYGDLTLHLWNLGCSEITKAIQFMVLHSLWLFLTKSSKLINLLLLLILDNRTGVTHKAVKILL